MRGILRVDKPAGWTSFDVVAKVRSIVAKAEGKKPRQIKVGHTGTLDPAATGLLVICVGKEYTRQVPTLIKHDKTYEVELTLGEVSTTGDREGEITSVSTVQPADSEIHEVLQSFIGEIEQTPPAYSAVKVDGKRAYELARAGKDVELKPRTVHVYNIEGAEYKYPNIRFTTGVSSGTYIRTLAEDIGKKLNKGGYMSALRRTEIGDLSVRGAIRAHELSEEKLRELLV